MKEMSDLVIAIMISLAGFGLGYFYFGGLLWTINRGLTAKKPWLWFLISWWIRTAIVMGSFYILFNGQWQRLVLALGGFLLARLVITRTYRPKPTPVLLPKEVGDAS